MSYKQELVKEMDGALHELKQMKKELSYAESKANHMENIHVHRGNESVFDSVGGFLDYFKIAKTSLASDLAKKNALDLKQQFQSRSNGVMQNVEAYKSMIDNKLSNDVPTSEQEKTIVEEFINLKDDEDVAAFRDKYESTISEQRNESKAFVFDDALDDFKHLVGGEEEEEKYQSVYEATYNDEDEERSVQR